MAAKKTAAKKRTAKKAAPKKAPAKTSGKAIASSRDFYSLRKRLFATLILSVNFCSKSLSFATSLIIYGEAGMAARLLDSSRIL